MKKLQVAIVERGKLVDVLRGAVDPRAEAVNLANGKVPGKLKTPHVGVGYLDIHFGRLPHFLVLPNSDFKEFYAWVNTYCPFVTPLSQWCRVVPQNDLPRVGTLEISPSYGNTITAWAGAIVGEAFLNVGSCAKLAEISVGALQACWTYVAAKTFGLWGTGQIGLESVERYGAARKILGAGREGNHFDYIEIWKVLEILSIGASSKVTDVSPEVELTIHACNDIQENGFVSREIVSQIVKELDWSKKLVDFEHIGAEQRVRLFDTAISNLFDHEKKSPASFRTLKEFTVSYFAARIGGSASNHLLLLEKFLGAFPMLGVWYGIVSGLYRPEVWGSEFDGLGRLVEKELNYPLRFDDPPRCDISFDELRTLAGPNSEISSLGFRGATKKTLNVEVALGVNGMVRLPETTQDDGGELRLAALQTEITKLYRNLVAATDNAAILNELIDPSGIRSTKKNRPSAKRRRGQYHPKKRGGSAGDNELPLTDR